MGNWVDVCSADEVRTEDVIGVELAGQQVAIYRSPDDEYFATDGLCTHERVKLCEGFVSEHTIECPKHGGVFDYTTGQAKVFPVTVNLRTYPCRVEAGRVLVEWAETGQ